MATLIYFSGAKILVPPSRLEVIMLLIILRIIFPPPIFLLLSKIIECLIDRFSSSLSLWRILSIQGFFFFIKKIGITCTQPSAHIFSLQLDVWIYTLYNHLPNQDIEAFNIWEERLTMICLIIIFVLLQIKYVFMNLSVLRILLLCLSKSLLINKVENSWEIGGN